MIVYMCARSGKMQGPGLLGLDRVNEKAPTKPEKKRIASSVLLSSVKRLGMYVYIMIYMYSVCI